MRTTIKIKNCLRFLQQSKRLLIFVRRHHIPCKRPKILHLVVLNCLYLCLEFVPHTIVITLLPQGPHQFAVLILCTHHSHGGILEAYLYPLSSPHHHCIASSFEVCSLHYCPHSFTSRTAPVRCPCSLPPSSIRWDP